MFLYLEDMACYYAVFDKITKLIGLIQIVLDYFSIHSSKKYKFNLFSKTKMHYFYSFKK